MRLKCTTAPMGTQSWVDIITGRLIDLFASPVHSATRTPQEGLVYIILSSMENQQQAEGVAYYHTRLARVSELEARGDTVYPHKFNVTETVTHCVDTYSGQYPPGSHGVALLSVAGRITRKRASSKKLIFYDVEQNGASVQILANFRLCTTGGDIESWVDFHEGTLRRGDIIGVTGHIGTSKSGELSVIATEIALLAPCLRMLPMPGKLDNDETRQRERHLDLIVNGTKVFRIRSEILAHIRNFFNDRHYLEVETPTMSLLPGGASAKPFVTYHNDLKMSMFMRVAPELFLKQLIVGGMDRVYEIGRNYRNEGFDATHNPEFTAIEAYEAYADYRDWMLTTEQLLSGMVMALCDSHIITYQGKKIDFSPPFARVPMMPTLEARVGTSIPLDDPVALDAILVASRVECPAPRTTVRMLDALVGHYIEPELVNPTFITDHPQIMCPLAKYHRDDPRLTERFELFVGGLELCNAYTELNDPKIQRRLFADQSADRDAGDDEAMVTDEGYCRAMEYGLPPTGGWGMGIDRLVMFLTDTGTIKDVILYPAARPTEEEREAQGQLRHLVQEAAEGNGAQ